MVFEKQRNADFNSTVQIESKSLQLKLAKDEIDYDSDEIQFFIPVIVTEECLEWLNLIAENTYCDEEVEVIKKFLDKTLNLRTANSKKLHKKVCDKILETLRRV